MPVQGCSTTSYKNLYLLVSIELNFSMPSTILQGSETTFPNTSFIVFFFFSPQPRTAIWLHLKHFASHLLSLGRNLGGLLHTVILSPATPAQSLAVNGEGIWGVPQQLRLHPGIHARDPFPPQASAKYLCTYIYICIYIILFKKCWQFISAPNGHWKILMGYL